MGKGNIQVFLRVKPERATPKLAKVDKDQGAIWFTIPLDPKGGVVNNTEESKGFSFPGDNIFDQDATQEEVWNQVAKNSIDNVLDGYNATIFAYGQTGSGKTFTMTGGMSNKERGIIHRSLVYLFNEFAKRSDYVYTTQVSYMEIYNEAVYDLLDKTTDATTLEEFAKITLLENGEGELQTINLNKYVVNKCEDALQWLFFGDTNRTIAETPMNQASSRSHCIFTVYLDARKEGSEKIRRSKIHLVDLAGSERLSKSNTKGSTLTESKNINLSLFYLERVIAALSHKNRPNHIPYRDSKLTLVLKDSLGGNCLTSMIATLSFNENHLMESISTCKFARRVGKISNEAIINEELHPQLMIAKLKKQVALLKGEVALKGGEEEMRELTDEEKRQCLNMVVEYIEDNSPTSALIIGSMNKIRECFAIMKNMVLELRTNSSRGDNTQETENMKLELKELRALIAEKEKEIQILKAMTKQPITHQESENNQAKRTNLESLIRVAEKDSENKPLSRILDTKVEASKPKSPPPDPQTAYKTFCKQYPNAEAIKDDAKLIHQKYGDIQILVKSINESKDKIKSSKRTIESLRKERAIAGLLNQDDYNENEETEEEVSAKKDMEIEKKKYKTMFEKLKELKTEVETLEFYQKQNKQKLQSDFVKWYQVMYGVLPDTQKSAPAPEKVPRMEKTPDASTNPPKSLDAPYNVSKSSQKSIGGWTEHYSQAASIPVNTTTNSNYQTKLESITGDQQADQDIHAFYSMLRQHKKS